MIIHIFYVSTFKKLGGNTAFKINKIKIYIKLFKTVIQNA